MKTVEIGLLYRLATLRKTRWKWCWLLIGKHKDILMLCALLPSVFLERSFDSGGHAVAEGHILHFAAGGLVGYLVVSIVRF